MDGRSTMGWEEGVVWYVSSMSAQFPRRVLDSRVETMQSGEQTVKRRTPERDDCRGRKARDGGKQQRRS